jgi:putative membrane protein
MAGWRVGAFLCGVLFVWAAVASPLATLDHRLLSIHMVRHLLLMAIAPPLILLGAPVMPFRAALQSSFMRGIIDPLLRCAGTQWMIKVFTKPQVGWFSATAVLIGWHVPGAFDLAMRSSWWHATEATSFLAAGFLFWMPVIRSWPNRDRQTGWFIPLYLFLATLPCDALSAFLTFCGRVVYPHYLLAQTPFGISALQDQESAGALMWVTVTFVYLIPSVVATIHILSPSSATLKSNGQPALEAHGSRF